VSVLLDSESTIGMDLYATSTPGINGRLKKIPEHFIVEEIPLDIPRSDTGIYVVLEIESRNWETNRLLKAISAQLRVSRHAIKIAGTKDRRAIKRQYISFRGDMNEISRINLNDFRIVNAFRSNKGIDLGKLWGNKFSIIVSDIEYSDQVTSDYIKNTLDELNGTFPNFFGQQRFGVLRPVTHLVGKEIIHRNWKEAVRLYVGNPVKEEDVEVYNARKFFDDSFDANQSIKLYPGKLTFETAILNQIIKSNSDYENGFSVLSKNLQMMFVHAYQSYIFNKLLSLRMKEVGDLNTLFLGDRIFPVSREQGVMEDKIITVDNYNISKIESKISEKKAVLALPIVGHSFTFSNGKPGEFEHKVIDESELPLFMNPDHREFSSTGYVRSANGFLFDLKWNVRDNHAFFDFILTKGCYATVFLREVMKTSPANYG
jgi:tRNA pseudouridine13 synthase